MTAIVRPAWPSPFDNEAAGRLQERFAALGRVEARLAARPDVDAMLRCVGGASPYLSDLVLREAATVARFEAEGADITVAAAMTALAQVRPGARKTAVASALRQAKRQVALVCALADIGGQWTLEQVTGALSSLAEATLGIAMAHLLRAAHDAGELRCRTPTTGAQGRLYRPGHGQAGGEGTELLLGYRPRAAV